MKDIFDKKDIKPMLLTERNESFNSPDYLYELKLDGIRTIIYVDKGNVEIRNKRNMRLNQTYPELADICGQIKQKCILDGEIIAVKDGKPDFYAIQKRSMMTNKTKIEFASKMYPVSFSAFDILYIGSEQITDKPLVERKQILSENIVENEKIIVSRYVFEKGVELYNAAGAQNLEGIVAKKKDSKYYFGKRSKDWIKIKNLQDDDYVICGYVMKPGNKVSLILGAYNEGALVRQGHVTMGVSRDDFNKVLSVNRIGKPLFDDPSGDEAIWIEPVLVCTVQYMMKSEHGHMRQPVFKGIRDDKDPGQCVVKVTE